MQLAPARSLDDIGPNPLAGGQARAGSGRAGSVDLQPPPAASTMETLDISLPPRDAGYYPYRHRGGGVRDGEGMGAMPPELSLAYKLTLLFMC